MKKFLSMFLILIMVVSLSACASPKDEKPETPTPPVEVNKDQDDDKNEDLDSEEDIKDEDEDEDKTEEQEDDKEAEVNIYYTLEEYIVTGNEDLEKLVSEKRKVNYGDITLEEAVVRELLKDPESEELFNSIPKSAKLIEVKVMDNTAYVDFSRDGMQGGSMEEDLAIKQIVTSLLDLGTVEKVQLLLDGEISETLMGHITISEPFDGK